MKKMIIEGGKELTGTITINGAKNSAVALIPAAILSNGRTIIKNVPNITDVKTLNEIIELLDGNVMWNNEELIIESSNIKNCEIPEKLTSKLRASYYFMGALLARFNHVEIYFPGGCNFGARQIDYHIKGFEQMGAKVSQINDKFIIDAKNLHGATIDLPFPSVGATINLVLAATKAKGTTIINNAAKEPEIINVCDFLKNMGAKITGEGTDTIEIEGVESLNSAEITVIPDRIEAGTYIIAGALMGNNLKIQNINLSHLEALLNKLDEMNIAYKKGENEIIISKAPNSKAIEVTTGAYPEFPTDLAQPISVLLSKANGTSHIEDTIYKKRLGHVAYLNKMGAKIEINENIQTIHGPINFTGSEVSASDLRAGATLFLAALTTEKATTISNVQFILRGYEKIVKKLSSVGANIKIIEIE